MIVSIEMSATAYARRRQRVIRRRRVRLVLAVVAGITLLLLWCFT